MTTRSSSPSWRPSFAPFIRTCGAVARGGGGSRQRSPSGRQRGPAGDHLHLPGRTAWTDRGGADACHRQVRELRSRPRLAGARRQHIADSCRKTPPTATAPRRLPSPATSSSSARWVRHSPSPAPASCSTPSWPNRSTTSRRSWNRASPTASSLTSPCRNYCRRSSPNARRSCMTATTTRRNGWRKQPVAVCLT